MLIMQLSVLDEDLIISQEFARSSLDPVRSHISQEGAGSLPAIWVQREDAENEFCCGRFMGGMEAITSGKSTIEGDETLKGLQYPFEAISRDQ